MPPSKAPGDTGSPLQDTPTAPVSKKTANKGALRRTQHKEVDKEDIVLPVM